MKNFRNKKPLVLPHIGPDELRKLDFDSFPTVQDFAVAVVKSEHFGWKLSFVSPTLGMLAGFPWWDHVDKDLARYTAQSIPVGTLEAPFDDLEQGWQIVIFRHEEYVYVLEGPFDQGTGFNAYFRVPRERYRDEWLRVIRRYNPKA